VLGILCGGLRSDIFCCLVPAPVPSWQSLESGVSSICALCCLPANGLTGVGLGQFGESIALCRTLISLALSFWNNQISGETLKRFAKGVGSCEKLTNIDLNFAYNEISYGCAHEMLQMFERKSVKNLDLTENRISGDEVETLRLVLPQVKVGSFPPSGSSHLMSLQVVPSMDVHLMSLQAVMPSMDVPSMSAAPPLSQEACQQGSSEYVGNMRVGRRPMDRAEERAARMAQAEEELAQMAAEELVRMVPPEQQEGQAEEARMVPPEQQEASLGLDMVTIRPDQDDEGGDHQVAGEVLHQLTQALATDRQESLLKLHLGDRQITDDTLGQIGDKIGQCDKLTSIDLDFEGNQISDEGLGRFGVGVGRCGKLTTLSLNFLHNQISGEVLGKFGQRVRLCAQLISIDLDFKHNKIAGEALGQFGEEIGQCAVLTSITVSFSGNIVVGETLMQFAKGIARCTSLASLHLDLSYNRITDASLGQFGIGVGDCAALTKMAINLRGNVITGEALGKFGEGIGKCVRLNSLDLNFARNQITDATLGQFGEGIGLCSQLASLDLDFGQNKLTGETLGQFGEGLGRSAALTRPRLHLRLMGNQISAEGARKLAWLLRDPTTRSQLDLRANPILPSGTQLVRGMIREGLMLEDRSRLLPRIPEAEAFQDAGGPLRHWRVNTEDEHASTVPEHTEASSSSVASLARGPASSLATGATAHGSASQRTNAGSNMSRDSNSAVGNLSVSGGSTIAWSSDFAVDDGVADLLEPEGGIG